jgi:RNA-directed DNA polymerase
MDTGSGHQDLLNKVRAFLESHRGIPFHVMLLKLNRIIRGWAHAYRRVVAKALMDCVDNRLYFLVRKWLRREHRSKTWAWIAKWYRKRVKGRVEFCASYTTAKGDPRLVRLFQAADLPIRYHVKIQSEATPYDPAYAEYFANRVKKRKLTAIRDRVHLNSTSYQKLAA